MRAQEVWSRVQPLVTSVFWRPGVSAQLSITANGRNDHVTMFILHLPLAIFSFSEKLSSLALTRRYTLKLLAKTCVQRRKDQFHEVVLHGETLAFHYCGRCEPLQK